MMETDFDQIRPFNDNEVHEAICRIINNPLFPSIVKFIYPNKDLQDFQKLLLKIDTIEDLQIVIMKNVIETLVNRSSTGISSSGFSQLSKDKNYLFIANHRDIFLDAAILQFFLVKNELKTSQIGFGNNLLQNDFITDFAKINKMFCVIRGLKGLAAYKNMQTMSAYIQNVLLEKRESVWIAQQSGRTKDGLDQTNTAILKMLSLHSEQSFLPYFSAINLTPLAISYEYEPCDFPKTQEVYLQKRGTYIKGENEDLQSILQGIMQPKGKIHLAVTPIITSEELKVCEKLCEKERYKKLAQIIDEHIYRNYHFWSNQYIAYDLLERTSQYSDHYTLEEKAHFEDYMQAGLSRLTGDPNELRTIFLNIYATGIKKMLQ